MYKYVHNDISRAIYLKDQIESEKNGGKNID
jgi:hypothetical protein